MSEKKYKFKGKLKGIDYINSLAEGSIKDNVKSVVKLASRDLDPAMSYKDITMLPYLEFTDLIVQFNKVYNAQEQSIFLEQK